MRPLKIVLFLFYFFNLPYVALFLISFFWHVDFRESLIPPSPHSAPSRLPCAYEASSFSLLSESKRKKKKLCTIQTKKYVQGAEQPPATIWPSNEAKRELLRTPSGDDSPKACKPGGSFVSRSVTTLLETFHSCRLLQSTVGEIETWFAWIYSHHKTSFKIFNKISPIPCTFTARWVRCCIIYPRTKLSRIAKKI